MHTNRSDRFISISDRDFSQCAQQSVSDCTNATALSSSRFNRLCSFLRNHHVRPSRRSNCIFTANLEERLIESCVVSLTFAFRVDRIGAPQTQKLLTADIVRTDRREGMTE